MTREVNNFLNKLQKENSAQHFLFLKFYFYPETFLNKDDQGNNFYKNSYFKFLMHNNFFVFLDLCLNDKHFQAKMDYNLFIEIKNLLIDCLFFVENYKKDLENERLQKWFRNDETINYWPHKYTYFDLWQLKASFKKVEWMYQLGLKKQKLDIKKLNQLIFKTNIQIENHFHKSIYPVNERKKILNKIINDNYEHDYETFLASHNGHSQEILLTIVCDNEFLNICEEFLMSQNLSPIVLNNIIDILEVSIAFKTIDYSLCHDFVTQYKKIPKDKLKAFDYQKARCLVKEFKAKYKPCIKLIKF